jgi:hypothetical protein
VRVLFTPAEDAFIIAHYPTLTFQEMAAALGRRYAGIQSRASCLVAQGRLDVHQRHYQRPWTEDDEDYLNDQWGKVSDTEMTKHLNRSPVALTIKAKRLGINRRQNVWTARNVAEVFGVDPKTVIRWLDRGWIQGKKAPFGSGGQRGEYRAWSFEEASLETFVREMGWAFDWRRMVEGDYLTRLAKSLDKADPWLTLGECGKLIRHHQGTVYRWTREGLAHQHRPKQSQSGPVEGIIVVQRSELLAFVERRRPIVHQNRSEAARQRMLRRYGQGEGEAA